MGYLYRFVTRRSIWLKSRLKKNRSVFLLYHRVGQINKETDPYSLTVSPENFKNHLSVLKNHFNVISLSEFMARISGNDLTGKYAVVTFDDGYSDNLYIVKPLLEEYKIPAAFFISTGYLGKSFWWDILSSYLSQGKKFIYSGREFFFNGKRNEMHKVIDELSFYLRSVDYKSKINLIDEIMYLNNSKNVSPKCLTRDEIKSISKSSFVEIGGHTDKHFPLSSLDKTSQEYEIVHNKKELENIIQKEINTFAYPNGDYDDSSINTLKNNFFSCGLTGELGINYNYSDPYILKRLSVLNWNRTIFYRYLKYWL